MLVTTSPGARPLTITISVSPALTTAFGVPRFSVFPASFGLQPLPVIGNATIVGVGADDGVGVGVGVSVGVGVGVGIGVGVGVGIGVGVTVDVGLGVAVGVGVEVGLGVPLGVAVGELVGPAAMKEAIPTTPEAGGLWLSPAW